jgi:hypothetical protein
MERKRLYIIGGIVFGVMLLLALVSLLMPKGGTLVITAPKSTAISTTITNSDNSVNKTVIIDLATSEKISLKAGSYKVASSSGAQKSIDVLTISEGNTTTLTVSFGAASSATRISADLDECPLVVGSAVFDYNCTNAGFVYQQNDDGTKGILFDSELFDYMVAYRSGMIGLPTDLNLHFMDPVSQAMQPITLPVELSASEDRDSLTVTTPSNPNLDYFAISLPSRDAIYLYNGVADTSPKKLQLPESNMLSEQNFMNSLYFSGDRLISYFGALAHSEEGEAEGEFEGSHTEAEAPEGKIVEYDLQGNVRKTITTPVGFEADQLIKLNDSYYAANRIEGIEFFYLNRGKLESIHTMDEIIKVVQVADKLYVQAEGSIYLFSPGKDGSFSVKSTYNTGASETLNDIYPGPGYLIFTATPNGSEVANVYRLELNTSR